MMTNKERMECLLAGGVPDLPPHWEIDFKLHHEMFGIDIWGAPQSQWNDRFLELGHRLVDDLNYAVVTNGFDLARIDKEGKR